MERKKSSWFLFLYMINFLSRFWVGYKVLHEWKKLRMPCDDLKLNYLFHVFFFFRFLFFAKVPLRFRFRHVVIRFLARLRCFFVLSFVRLSSLIKLKPVANSFRFFSTSDVVVVVVVVENKPVIYVCCFLVWPSACLPFVFCLQNVLVDGERKCLRGYRFK